MVQERKNNRRSRSGGGGSACLVRCFSEVTTSIFVLLQKTENPTLNDFLMPFFGGERRGRRGEGCGWGAARSGASRKRLTYRPPPPFFFIYLFYLLLYFPSDGSRRGIGCKADEMRQKEPSPQRGCAPRGSLGRRCPPGPTPTGIALRRAGINTNQRTNRSRNKEKTKPNQNKTEPSERADEHLGVHAMIFFLF